MSRLLYKYIVLLNALFLSVGSVFSASTYSNAEIDYANQLSIEHQSESTSYINFKLNQPESYIIDLSEEIEVNTFLKKVEEFKEYTLDYFLYENFSFTAFELKKKSALSKSKANNSNKSQLYLIYCNFRI